MLLTRQQDPVGLVLFDEKANTVLPPNATQSQVIVMSGLLERCVPARKTELGGLLRSLTDQIQPQEPDDHRLRPVHRPGRSSTTGLNRLRFLGHEVLVLQVLDRDEMELPFDGPTVFRDIEGEEELFAEPWAFRRSYQKAMEEFLDGVRQECGKRGYDHVRFFTDEPLGASLSSFLHSRQASERSVRQGGRA